MYRVKLSYVATVVSKHAHNCSVAPSERSDDVISVVGDQDIFLSRIMRKDNVTDGSGLQSFRMHEEFLQEFALLGKYLNSIIAAIANINQPLDRDVRTMDRGPELLIDGSIPFSFVRSGIGIVRDIPVCTPHTLESQRIRVINDHALIHVSIRDIQLVGGFIDLEASRPAQDRCICAVHRFCGWMAKLLEKFSVIGELQYLAIIRAIAANLDISGFIDINSMFHARPIVARTAAASGF